MKAKKHKTDTSRDNSDTSFCEISQPIVPAEKKERDHIFHLVEKYVVNQNITPPLSKEELWQYAQGMVKGSNLPTHFCDLVKVLINNEIWKDTIASVPYERRLLLIPQCLRSTKDCQAEIDEFGLLCEQCGCCPIGDIQREAEELGYVVLIAEGTTVVTSLLESGKVDAVIGVSCLNVLEKTFPYMVTNAVPGIAIPLICDGCVDTKVDLDWLGDGIKLKSNEFWVGHQELQQWHQEVNSWFESENLKRILPASSTDTRKLAVSWLSGNGKRWRPFLAVIVFKALNGVEKELPESIKKLAVAVECFHKASLIHDDIEDEDDFRYGEATLHRKHGVPIALNIGDLLIGEGYRLISECGTTSEQICEMLTSAAEGHHSLCIGQGEELLSLKNDSPPSCDKILEIFRCKTSPAFEVALSLGAFCAGADGEICKILKKISESLGIAYQIQDDIDDFHAALEKNSAHAVNSSLLLSMAWENAVPDDRKKIIAFWKSPEPELLKIIVDSNAEVKAKQLAEYYKNEAIRSLALMKNAPLKSLLRKVIGKIVDRKSEKQMGADNNPNLG